VAHVADTARKKLFSVQQARLLTPYYGLNDNKGENIYSSAAMAGNI